MKYNFLSVAVLFSLIASCTHPSNKEIASQTNTSQRNVAEDLLLESENQYFNLYETNWSTIKDIPVYDQSGLPACYSYAGSQFVEYYLRKNQSMRESNQHVSPIWTAYNYKRNVTGTVGNKIKKRKSMTIGYGEGKKAIKLLSDSGVCRSDLISNNLSRITGSSRLSDSDSMALVELVIEQINTASAESINDRIKADWRYTEVVQSASHPHLLGSEKSSASDIRSNVVHIYNYLKGKVKSNDINAYFDFFEQEVALGCSTAGNTRKYNIPLVRSVGKVFASNNGINRKIQRGFEKGNFQYPVVIGYCSNIFKFQTSGKKVTERNLAPRVLQRTLQPSEDCSAHYSLVMGKRYNTNTRNYDILVRNSYGNEYMQVSNGCFCRNKASNQFENCESTAANKVYPPSNLEVLGCWLDQDKVAETVYDVISYKLNGESEADDEL